MLSASEFRDLISGRRRGWRAELLRVFCRAAEMPYGLAVRARNWRYDLGLARAKRVGVPVVSVGNLTVGGTGKTPMIEWLARWFCKQGVRVTLISRGYGSKTGSRNDEAIELEQKLPTVPHLQDPDRVAAAQVAIEQHHCQVILLDDAFQHRRIHRDLDIVLIDALQPFGFGHLLPRGLLREAVSGVARSDIIAVSRADAVSIGERVAIFDRVRRYAPHAICLEVSHRPQHLLCASGGEAALQSLTERPVAAFCGIGNPDGFRHTLQSCGYTVQDFREFPDHHAYSCEDIQSLAQWADGFSQIGAVLCTHKDLVKINRERLGNHPLWALTVGMHIMGGEEALQNRLKRLLAEHHLPT